MIELQLRADRLVAHAQANGHNHAADEDLGYAVHAWLQSAFGALAPTCFRTIPGRADRMRVLGYARTALDSLHDHAQAYASPLAFGVCDWSLSASKSMDDVRWQAGQGLRFEVRVCPVVRGKQGERDAFLAVLPAVDGAARRGREEVYRDWLLVRLGETVTVTENSVRLKAFRLVSTWRRGNRGASGAARGRRVIRPDALMIGRIEIRAPTEFPSLLERGVGRHRAFGFGMLLVRPA